MTQRKPTCLVGVFAGPSVIASIDELDALDWAAAFKALLADPETVAGGGEEPQPSS
jgi:hypothetical protein